MKHNMLVKSCGTVLIVAGLSFYGSPGMAQNQMQEKVAEVREMVQANRQQLSRYTWQMQQTVSVSGDVKQDDLFAVQLGPDGQQVRTLLAQPVAPQSGGRQHGIKHRMKQDFVEYAREVADLAKSYSQLSGSRIQQLYARGDVSIRSGGAPGYSAIVIANYLKPGDSVVVTVSDQPKALYSVNVSSYLSQPSDAVTMQVRYASLPSGTTYAATTTVNGQSKGLTVVDQSTNFALRPQ